jgi:hypothetical protein
MLKQDELLLPDQVVCGLHEDDEDGKNKLVLCEQHELAY